MFGGAPFTTRTYRVPANAEILLYSDGAYELDLPDGRPWSLKQFIDTVTEVTAGPDWSLDELLTRIQAETESGSFDDDCTLVRLRIS